MNYKGISNPKLITVFELTKEAHSSMDTEKCVSTILRRISDILDTEVGSVMLVDEKRQELFIKKASGLDSDVVKQTRVKIGESVSGWVAKEGKSLLVKDISRDSRFKKR
ncbi:MAG: GAF domain-containing protein, partial [Candidatus Orphnella occulta]|nr:GAF domain-containing protein [Candidatus Orphnella occulta]